MKVIYKYELDVIDRQAIKMPKGANILSIQVQNGEPHIWAMVDNEAETELRDFATIGTGNPVHIDPTSPFIATYQIMEGALVFHVFEIV